MMNINYTPIRPKVTVDYCDDESNHRLTIAPNDENDEWTVIHHRCIGPVYSIEEAKNELILSIPNSDLDNLIKALTLYRNNLKELNYGN